MLAPGLVLACAAAVIGMAARPAPQADALFEFHSNPWLNLHHILWARGEPATPPADTEREPGRRRDRPERQATLERLMPIYRKHWWPAHDRKNREWIAAARTLVDRHGAALSAALARAYSVVPDNPVWVQIPDSTGAWTVTFGADKILLLPGSRQRLSGRPVVGASVVVTRLANVRSELQASGLNPVVDATSTILLPPELTCGIWLEFREGR